MEESRVRIRRDIFSFTIILLTSMKPLVLSSILIPPSRSGLYVSMPLTTSDWCTTVFLEQVRYSTINLSPVVLLNGEFPFKLRRGPTFAYWFLCMGEQQVEAKLVERGNKENLDAALWFVTMTTPAETKSLKKNLKTSKPFKELDIKLIVITAFLKSSKNPRLEIFLCREFAELSQDLLSVRDSEQLAVNFIQMDAKCPDKAACALDEAKADWKNIDTQDLENAEVDAFKGTLNKPTYHILRSMTMKYMNLSFTPTKKSKAISLQLCDRCGLPSPRLSFLKVHFKGTSRDNLFYCEKRVQFGDSSLTAVLGSPFDRNTWITFGAFVLLIMAVLKENRISGGLDFVWNFLSQPAQHKNNTVVISLGLLTLVLQQIYLTYLTSRITLPFESVQPINDIPTLFSSGYRIILTRKQAKSPQKFIAFYNASFARFALGQDPMKLLLIANDTGELLNSINKNLLKYGGENGAILAPKGSEYKVKIRAEADKEKNVTCYMIQKSFYSFRKATYFRRHHSVQYHRFLSQFYMFGFGDYWAQAFRVADRRKHFKNARDKTVEVVVSSIGETTPMSQSFLLCTFIMALTLPVFLLECSWFQIRRKFSTHRVKSRELVIVLPRDIIW